MAERPVALHQPGFYTTHSVFTPPTFNTPGVAHSATVFINGLPVHKIGDTSEIHCIPGTIPPVCDVEVVAEGAYPTIICEGKLMAPIGAKTAPGGCVLTWGSHSVICSMNPPGEGVVVPPGVS